MKILVTGISGLLGLNTAAMLRDRAQVSGCYWRHPVRLPGVEAVPADLSRRGVARDLIAQIRPDVVIHTAGLTSVDECEARPAQAQRLNVHLAGEVAAAARAVDAALVHLSSDHLFTGVTAWHGEEERPAPVNVYARTKAAAEQAVLSAHDGALIVRTNFFGWGTPIRESFSDWILRGLRQRRELSMFTDVFFTPILINDLAEAVLELLEAGARGILHVAGAARLSKYEFGVRVADVFEITPARITPATIEAARLRAPRPKDMSLRSDRAATILGRPLPGAVEGLQRLRNLERAGWPSLLSAALDEEYAGGVPRP